MTSSVERVEQALRNAGLRPDLREMAASTRTAADSAAALGVGVNQIAKSIILEALDGESLFLFITAGSNGIDLPTAASLA